MSLVRQLRRPDWTQTPDFGALVFWNLTTQLRRKKKTSSPSESNTSDNEVSVLTALPLASLAARVDQSLSSLCRFVRGRDGADIPGFS